MSAISCATVRRSARVGEAHRYGCARVRNGCGQEAPVPAHIANGVSDLAVNTRRIDPAAKAYDPMKGKAAWMLTLLHAAKSTRMETIQHRDGRLWIDPGADIQLLAACGMGIFAAALTCESSGTPAEVRR